MKTTPFLLLSTTLLVFPLPSQGLEPEIPIHTYKIKWAPASCDKTKADKALKSMRPLQIMDISSKNEWVVVTFGHQYYRWDETLQKILTSTFMDASTCSSGTPQKYEFHSPTGKLLTRIIVVLDPPKL